MYSFLDGLHPQLEALRSIPEYGAIASARKNGRPGWIVENGKIGFRWSILFDYNFINEVTKS